jgi:hypothetical protein
MGQLLDVIDSGTTPLRQVALSILSAYLMSHAIAALYAWTRRGQEHSRNFVKALVIGGIVGAMIMLAIGNSLARGVCIVGALALIRFRTNLRDPLDMIFIFAAFAAGISAGAGNIETGFVGTAIFLLVVYVLHISGGGTSQVGNGIYHANRRLCDWTWRRRARRRIGTTHRRARSHSRPSGRLSN